MKPRHIILTLLLMLLGSALAEPPESPIGLRSQINDLILPGSELEAKPLEPGAPVVVRVLATRIHGDAFRYDLEYYGLEPGTFDLVDFLQPKAGAARDETATVPVKFTAVLPADRLTPNEPEPGEVPKVGGYKTLLVLAGIIWVAVLLLLIFYRRKSTVATEEAAAPPPTFADRLRPLVESARDGKLDEAGQAELERTLLGFWREELDLSGESPATALAKLRQHEGAAPLLQQLEQWLHSPDSKSAPDIDGLLKPYADRPAEA